MIAEKLQSFLLEAFGDEHDSEKLAQLEKAVNRSVAQLVSQLLDFVVKAKNSLELDDEERLSLSVLVESLWTLEDSLG